MDLHIQEMAPKAPERPRDIGEVAVDVAQETRQVLRQDTEAMVRARTQEAERAARATQEMKDPVLQKVEFLLSDGLADEFVALNSTQKAAFKEEGEKLAVWLHDALTQDRVRPHLVLSHIEKWLLIIQARDRAEYWLRQEAYIRARRAMREMMSNEQNEQVH